MPSASLSVPHFRQESNYSCVAACVRMVLRHCGSDQSEADIRQLLGTTPFGTRAASITAVAALGFDVRVSASSLRQLQLHLVAGTPAIVFLKTGVLDYWSVD